jgi:type I restriction enzyme R subunit
MSNFSFLNPEFSFLYECGKNVERQVILDPRAACFSARYGLERAVLWMYEVDRNLRTPYDTKLDTLLNASAFKRMVPQMTFNKMMVIKKMGNQAVHSRRTVTETEALSTCKELFHVYYWIARTYMRQGDPRGLQVMFKADRLPKPLSADKIKQAFSTVEELQAKEETYRKELKQKEEALAEREKTMADQARSLEEREAQLAKVDAELAETRQSLAEVKRQNEAIPDSHDYSEDQTRKFIIDLYLREAGWEQGKDWTDEVEVQGMPNNKGVGYVDYVLWGDNGLPLAVVEAKRTSKDSNVGQQQAKLYADCLEKMKGQRPVIFYTNGYETWLWDDTNYPPRVVQGFYNKEELKQMIQRRSLAKSITKEKPNEAIAGRFYQTRAILAIGEHFEQKQRRALLTMATGTGKTRTSIALVDLLMRCNWVKRVLFLADRVALVNQAINAFKAHLPDSSPVNLVTEKDGQGRVYGSTYPTMMGLIDQVKDGKKSYSVGHFDLIVIDEAHRSVYQKYGAIFDYFDALIVGLTATPRDEVHHDTYHLFGLETGVPTDAYGLDEAVGDGYLVPPRSISVPIRYPREGIQYDELSQDEQEHWESLDWDEEDGTPEEVSANAVNKWVFNEDTVDKVLKHLMLNGQKVAGGDQLGKTIIFAKNQKHAEFIEQRFNHHYPQLKGHFARIITHASPYAQSLIEDFSKVDHALTIAISVDMLDTGIDVPEVLNLVFFKVVRSKTKFLQMVGRGTRLCPDLFAPGEDKSCFTIFDFCGNLEYFKENPDGIDGSHSEPLGKRLFNHRLELLEALQSMDKTKEVQAGVAESPSSYSEDGLALDDVVSGTIELLHGEVSAMNLDNFIVRPKRKHVEAFREKGSWQSLSKDKMLELHQHIAGLPSELEPEDINAKLFDLTCLKLQLGIVQPDTRFASYRQQVMTIAANLEEKESIPMVKKQMALIQSVQTDEYWSDITLPLLETLRRKLRSLVQFVDKKQREPVYTVLEDELGEAEEIELDNFQTGINVAQYKKKVEQYIRSNENHITIHKLKFNEPLTETDLKELERFLFETGEAQSREQFEEIFGEQLSLPVFIRSLVGLDRGAAKDAFGKFLNDSQCSTSQIQFIELIIDYLTQKGVMDPGLLYEDPFTGIHYEGLDGVFPGSQGDEIINILDAVRNNTAV